MSKLVDKERLAKLAKALDQRAKAAVKAEETRALQAEARIEGKADQNATAIAAINNEENGILAQAKGYTDAAATELDKRIQTKVSTSVYEAKVTELENKDKDMAADILGLDTAVKGIEERLGDGELNLPAIDEAIKDFKEEQLAVDNKQNQDIAAAAEAAAKAQEEVDALEGVVGGIEDRVEIVEEFVEGHSHVEIEADIQTLEGKVEQLEAFKQAHDHKPMEDRIAALEEMHGEGGDVDQKIKAVQDDVDALAGDFSKFKGEQVIKEQAQDELIAAKLDKSVYDAKMELLDAEDQRLDQAIKDEAARALAAEQAIDAKIAAINNGENGLLAQAKALVDAEKDLRVAADEALQGQIDDAVEAAGLLEGRVAANEAKLAGLKKDTVQGAIDDAEANAKAHAEQKIADLVNSAPEAMNTLKELADEIAANEGIYNAYVAEHATAMQAQKEALQKEIDDDIAAARTLISAEIDADVKEEADRAKLEEQAIRTDFAAADAALEAKVNKKIADDIAAESALRQAEEADIRADFAAADAALKQELQGEISSEAARAAGEEARIEAAYKAADAGLNERLAAVEGIVGTGGEQNALEVINGKVAALEAKDADLVKEDVRLQGEIDKKVAQADYDAKVEALEAEDERIAGLVGGLDDRVEVLEGEMDAVEGKVATLEGFMNNHSHAAMEAQIAENKQGVADNKAAIEKEVEDRAAAIEEALKPYATEAETLAVIGQVVNSLALTMENNKMVLKLGGVEGVAINEVSLDMVTDADIDEIINGLDVNPTIFNF